MIGYLLAYLSACRPCESRDPYPVPSRGTATYGSCVVVVSAILTTLPAFATEIPPGERRSDYDLMSAQTRAMQDDDTPIPAC
jgi:hypothetical protein